MYTEYKQPYLQCGGPTGVIVPADPGEIVLSYAFIFSTTKNRH